MLEKLIHYDDHKIFDRLESKARQNRFGPLGFVRIFLYTKNSLIYDEGWNLVVAQGREYVAQRLSNCYSYSGGTRENWTGYIVSHFAVGSGGSTVGQGEQITLNGPYVCDTTLYEAISLQIDGYLTEPSGVQKAVKHVTANGGSVLLEPQGYSGGGTCEYYTKVKFTCVVPSGEPADLPPDGTVKIDEAGLYFVSGSTVKMFAHICFAPKWKEKESTLIIMWYILC